MEKQPVMCNLCKMLHLNKTQTMEDYENYWSNYECIADYGSLLTYPRLETNFFQN